MMRFVVLVITGSLLIGCNQSPGGDVIAVVNGEEITRPELNAAMPSVPAGADATQVRNAVLDRMVNERLLVQAAKRNDLDKSQDYILKLHAAENLILSSMFVNATSEKFRQPLPNDIADYINDNPSRFAARVVFVLDQIKVARQTVHDDWIKEARSLDDIGRILSAHQVLFDRARVTVDSMALDPADYRQMAAIPKGKLYAVVQNGVLTISDTVATQPSPVTGEDAHRAANGIMRQKIVNEGLQNGLKVLKTSAKIDYLPGFAPAAQASAAKGK